MTRRSTTLRGIAITLMVAGHVIGWNSGTGMKVADDSGWRYYDLLFADLRMPLFAALSGFVYALRPLSPDSSYRRFLRGKSRRLLVPLIVVGTAFLLVQSFTPDANEHVALRDEWHVYVYGVAHFWFLQAIFLIFVLVGVLDIRGLLSTRSRLLRAVALASVASVVMSLLSTDLPPRWDLFSFVGGLSLLPFFLLGYLFCAHGRDVVAPRWALLGLTVVLFTINALAIFGTLTLSGLESPILGVLLGLSGVSTLLMFRSALAWRPLARLGYFSFAIYLLHVFGAASTRIVLSRAGIDGDVPVFVICLIAGLALPTVFEITVGRVSWISWAFLGQKAYRNPWSTAVETKPGPGVDAAPEALAGDRPTAL